MSLKGTMILFGFNYSQVKKNDILIKANILTFPKPHKIISLLVYMLNKLLKLAMLTSSLVEYSILVTHFFVTIS